MKIADRRMKVSTQITKSMAKENKRKARKGSILGAIGGVPGLGKAGRAKSFGLDSHGLMGGGKSKKKKFGKSTIDSVARELENLREDIGMEMGDLDESISNIGAVLSIFIEKTQPELFKHLEAMSENLETMEDSDTESSDDDDDRSGGGGFDGRRASTKSLGKSTRKKKDGARKNSSGSMFFKKFSQKAETVKSRSKSLAGGELGSERMDEVAGVKQKQEHFGFLRG